MDIEFDTAKDEGNIAKHGVSLQAASDFDFDTAQVVEDDRFDYGETRFVALGKIGQRVHVLVFTRRGATIRVISLRKANDREVRHYEG